MAASYTLFGTMSTDERIKLLEEQVERLTNTITYLAQASFGPLIVSMANGDVKAALLYAKRVEEASKVAAVLAAAAPPQQ